MGYKQTLEAIAAELRGALPYLPSHDRRDAQAFLDLVVDAIEREKNAVVLTTVGGGPERTTKIYSDPVIDARLMRREGLRRLFPVPRPEPPSPPAAPAKPPLEHRYLREGEPEVQEAPLPKVPTPRRETAKEEQARYTQARREQNAWWKERQKKREEVRHYGESMERPKLPPLARVGFWDAGIAEQHCELSAEQWAAVDLWNAVEEEDTLPPRKFKSMRSKRIAAASHRV